MFRIGLADAFNRGAIVLLLVLVITSWYREHFLDSNDPFKCGALLDQGQWLDPEHRPFRNWQPPGCIFREYTTSDIAECTGGRIVIAGDTTTRQIFWALARKIQGNDDWVEKEQHKQDMHGNLKYSKDGVNLKFLWDPFLNTTALHYELKMLRDGQTNETGVKDNSLYDWSIMDFGSQKPATILLGGGLWHARHLDTVAVEFYKNSVDKIITGNDLVDLRTMTQSTDGIGDQIFVAPVVEPFYERLSPSRQNTIVPSKIDGMNAYLRQLSDAGLNVIWSYAEMTRNQTEAYGYSGLHFIEPIAARKADILLNLHCNGKATQRLKYPMDRTCCSTYRSPSWLFIVPALAFFARLVMVIVSKTRGSSIFGSQSQQSTGPSLTEALRTAVVVCFYCMLADRTHFFDKVPAQFSTLDYRLLLGLAIALCLLYVREEQAPSAQQQHPSHFRRRSSSSEDLADAHQFLPRTQSDEFKGWMQVFILIYGFTGASDMLTPYEIFRICFSMYLFLLGYGHTMYFLQTRDFSIERVAAVLTRMNVLAICLSFVMDRPYLTYDWAPLISFWFLIVYITLRTAHYRNESLGFLIGKIVVAIIGVTLMIYLRGPLEMISLVFRVAFRADFIVEHWRSLLEIESFIVFLGMLIAIFNIQVINSFRTPEKQRSISAEIVVDFFDVFRRLFIISALATGPLFWWTAQSHTRKRDYDWFMPFLSWMPILSLVLFRNATLTLRKYHCTAFSWIGRFSLELHLLSQHIFLAADGKGVLSVGFRGGDLSIVRDRWRDFLLLAPPLIWCAWKQADVTRFVTAWVAGPAEEQKREHNRRVSHARGGSGLLLPDYDYALPRPNSRRGSEQGGKQGNEAVEGGLRPKKRLIILTVVLWVAKLFA